MSHESDLRRLYIRHLKRQARVIIKACKAIEKDIYADTPDKEWVKL